MTNEPELSLFRIFNLKTITYRDAGLKEVRSLARNLRFRGAFSCPEYVVLSYSLTEEMMQQLMTVYSLNPILYQEICQKQVMDKMLVIDEETHYYHLNVHQEYSHKDITLVKMIEIKRLRTLLILTDQKHPSFTIKDFHYTP
jgi:hypothetical protein